MRFIQTIRKMPEWFDVRLGKRYKPRNAAWFGTAIVLIISICILFLPNYNGMADDGSLAEILERTGLGYTQSDQAEAAGAYFVRVYVHQVPVKGDGISIHDLLIRLAVAIDDLFTGDNLFDIRFLAAVYLLIFLPGVFLLLRSVTEKAHRPSEGVALALLGAWFLSDVAFVSYFNSLYPDALWRILLIYLCGFSLMLLRAQETAWQVGISGTVISATLLSFTEKHAAAIALATVLFLLIHVATDGENRRMRRLALTGAVITLTCAIIGWNATASRFTEASKMNAMTSGVLQKSLNPVRTLEEFGIDARFELFTDESTYDSYPLALAGNEDIQENFLAKYEPVRLLVYYLRHPGALAGLIGTATTVGIQARRSYLGNYEKMVGFLPRARAPLFGTYSSFRSSSIPGSVGFWVVIAIVFPFLGGTESARRDQRGRRTTLTVFYLVIAIALFSMVSVILLSGTAELERYGMITGTCVDLCLYLMIAEVLHRLNILE